MSNRYDVIIVGSGPGGASVAHKLAPTGKRILLLERGDYLPRSPANWDSQTVFVDAAYQAKETWYGADGQTFHPGLHYFVGGNSKFHGHSNMLSLNPITQRLNVSSTCMASVVRIQPNRRPADPFLILPFRTNPRYRH
jgi:uncharacterized protein with NAD-binding domain and iron-sulfur cluster